MHTVPAVVFLYILVSAFTAAPFVAVAWRLVDERIKSKDSACLAARDWLESSLAPPCRVPVESITWRNDGRDVCLSLTSDGCLRLRCFWPRRVDVTHLLGAVFRDDLGWVIDAEVPNGDRVRFYAWQAMYSAKKPSSPSGFM